MSLDVGTDNEQLLNDQFYVGNRHARRRGADYDEFIQNYVETAHRLFPKAMLHFEDFGPGNARAILDKYSSDYCVYNDDVQGTGAVIMAALYSGMKVTGIPMRDQKMVIFGAGTAGIGIADQFRDAMVADGATVEQATSQIWPIDKQGLLFDDMDDLRDFQVPYAKNRRQLGVDAGDRMGLLDTIKMASPTILIGCSSVPGAFSREVIEAMAAATERPLIFPISNPTSRMEAMPADIIGWSDGKALVATGSPVAPVEYNGTTYTIGQANNVLVFPGIGLGVVVAGAQRVTKRMLDAAAKAVAQQADPTPPGAALLPDVKDLRAISTVVAEAVYHAAVEDGVATKNPDRRCPGHPRHHMGSRVRTGGTASDGIWSGWLAASDVRRRAHAMLAYRHGREVRKLLVACGGVRAPIRIGADTSGVCVCARARSLARASCWRR